MQVRSVLAIAIGISALTAVTAHAAEKTVLAGNTGLTINSSPRMDLVTSVPIDYYNRASGRVVNLRVAQPLLCADFATPPGASRVAFQFQDPNGDVTSLLYGGISSFDYFGNGGATSLFKVTADAQLACCIMQPAANAACFQGTAGGSSGDGLFSSGFENVAAAASSSVTVDPVDLAVVVSGPASATPNSNYSYTIEVSNLGTNTVSNVVVRDWYPKSSGGFSASLGSGTWTCTPTGVASCGSANGSGNIGLVAISLNAGAKVTFAVSRPVAGTAPNGSTFSVSAAAFAPPSAAETALGNNQGSRTATVSPTSFSISDVTQAEGNSGSSNFQFTITRSNTAGAASVQVSTADSSAAAGSDYTAITGQTVNFTAGGSATAVVNITVNGDTTLEANETFAVNLSNPSGGSIGDGQGIGSITNDDSASIAINDVAITEGNSGSSNATFTVTLTGAVQGGFTVPVTSSNGSATAGSDYTAIAANTNLSFTGTLGETRTVSVAVTGDSVVEAAESFNVNLGTPSNAQVNVTDNTGVGTINNDDASSLSINDVALSEGNSGSVNATFTVTLSNAVQGGFTVPFATANSSATAGSDYTAISGGSLSFAGTVGETQLINVAVLGDTTLEANESFQVNLGSPTNAAVTLTDGNGVGTINNDDNASISIADASVIEGNAGTTPATFTVTLNGSVQGGFSVAVVSQSGTATGGIDFVDIVGGNLNFAGTPGETQSINVLVNGDAVLEGNESYFVNLGVPSNAAITLTDSQAVGTITNDDAASLAINNVAVTEGNTGTVNATFTVTLTGAVQGSFLVPLSSADDSATVAGNDYLAIAGNTNLTFTGALNETQTISVVVNGDPTVEANETFFVNVGTPGNAAITVSQAQGVGTITNDDSPSQAD